MKLPVPNAEPYSFIYGRHPHQLSGKATHLSTLYSALHSLPHVLPRFKQDRLPRFKQAIVLLRNCLQSISPQSPNIRKHTQNTWCVCCPGTLRMPCFHSLGCCLHAPGQGTQFQQAQQSQQAQLLGYHTRNTNSAACTLWGQARMLKGHVRGILNTCNRNWPAACTLWGKDTN